MDGIITSSFGVRMNPLLEKQELHTGVDIAVAEKTEVLAVTEGIVAETGKSNTYGLYLKFSTGTGYDIMYAHLSKINVKKDDKINRGDVIALSGNTGLSTGPHLHYSIWKDGTLIDPINYLTDLKYTEEVKNEYLARGEKIK